MMWHLTDGTRAIIMIAAWAIGQLGLFVYIYYAKGRRSEKKEEDE